jgi:hypothetical protein
MIVTGDIATILYKKLLGFGIEVYKGGTFPTSKVTKERIVIIPKRQSSSKYWKKGFVEINFLVPDDGRANTKRLTELERMANQLEGYGVSDGTSYRYGVESISQEEDTSLECHFVNCRILFEVLNTKL